MENFAVYNVKKKSYTGHLTFTKPEPEMMLPLMVHSSEEVKVNKSPKPITSNSNEPELMLPYGVVESAKVITSNSNEPELLLPFGVHE